MKCAKNYKDMEKLAAYKKRNIDRYRRGFAEAENRMQPWTVRELDLVME